MSHLHDTFVVAAEAVKVFHDRLAEIQVYGGDKEAARQGLFLVRGVEFKLATALVSLYRTVEKLPNHEEVFAQVSKDLASLDPVMSYGLPRT